MQADVPAREGELRVDLLNKVYCEFRLSHEKGISGKRPVAFHRHGVYLREFEVQMLFRYIQKHLNVCGRNVGYYSLVLDRPVGDVYCFCFCFCNL